MNPVQNKNPAELYKNIQPFVNFSLQAETPVGDSKILVIAPNQIDESVGCAGTLLKYANLGAKIEIIFCSQDTNERMREAEKAAHILGSKKNHFILFGSGTLSRNKNFEDNLFKLIDGARPDIVFAPFWIDKHYNSVAVAKAFYNIVPRMGLFDFRVFVYSIWPPLNPNCIFDISEEWKAKKEAIECYSSLKHSKQHRNYLKIADSINQYWAQIMSPSMEYAETFFKCSAHEYALLGKKIF